MCALISGGDVYCWGLNSADNHLFGGAPFGRRVASPTRVPNVTNLTTLSLSAAHACGLDTGGDTWCWGNNEGYACGGALDGGVFPPTRLSMPTLVQVVAGHRQTCGRDGGGTVYCVGDAAGTTPSPAPSSVAGPAGTGVIDLASAPTSTSALTCSLTAGGAVHCWGQAPPVALPASSLDPPPTRLAVTRSDEVFVTNGLAVQRSIYGGAWSAFAAVPQGALTGQIVALSADAEICALTSAGRLFCADDFYGAIPPGGFVERAGLGDVVAVSAAWTPLQGAPYSCAASGNDVWCWGDDYAGGLGIGMPHLRPAAISMGQSGVLRATAAAGSTLIQVGTDWRRAGESRALRGGADTSSSSSFELIPALQGATGAWVGDQEHGTQAYAVYSPSSAARFEPSGAKQTTGGLLAAGSDWREVWLSGRRVFGLHASLGLHSLGAASPAVDALLGTGVASGGDVAAVDTGLSATDGFTTYRVPYNNELHACAWDTGSGAATCWGSNSVGQCGLDPLTTPSLATPPPPLANLPGTKAMCAGWAHTCAVGADDLVRCWGSDYLGQLGRGAAVGSDHAPELVTTSASTSLAASELVCGYGFTCALGLDARVYCWGANDDGELGRGTLSEREDRATPVAGVTDALSIVAGSDHACAVVGPGRELRCWGSSYWGQLGVGVRGFGLSPTRTIW